MSKPWIRLGCYLTGYNYRIVSASSEITAKAVKRYTSAILIVCLLWSFIGYMFTKRYLFGTAIDGVIGATVMVLIVIQIERQIILSVHPSKWLIFARSIIAILMAIIGSIIVDQILFKQDIELEKITYIQARVNASLPGKTAELRTQIASLDSAIQKKEGERTALIDEVTKAPFIKSTSTEVIPSKVQTTTTDSLGRTTTSEKMVPASNVGGGLKAVVNNFNKAVASLESRFIPQARRLHALGPAYAKDSIPNLEQIDLAVREVENPTPPEGDLPG